MSSCCPSASFRSMSTRAVMRPEIKAKAELIARFVSRKWAQNPDASSRARPLLVSMQGPQGCGKSTLAAAMVSVLKSQHDLNCSVSSMDDFYLPHAGLKALAASYPQNAMLQGRGPPGTHDLIELSSVLSSLRKAKPVDLPSFDKSLHGGEGDRVASTRMETLPDVFVLEGWSLGYAPLPESEMRTNWERGATASTHSFESMRDLNTNLAKVNDLPPFDAHVRIIPRSYNFVYNWRLEQEHKMKEGNGGVGMSDEQVRKFVDRYMPTYEVWGETRPSCRRLEVVFDQERLVVESSER